MNQSLFTYFSENHGLPLLESELSDIEQVVNAKLCQERDQAVNGRDGLVNALHRNNKILTQMQQIATDELEDVALAGRCSASIDANLAALKAAGVEG